METEYCLWWYCRCCCRYYCCCSKLAFTIHWSLILRNAPHLSARKHLYRNCIFGVLLNCVCVHCLWHRASIYLLDASHLNWSLFVNELCELICQSNDGAMLILHLFTLTDYKLSNPWCYFYLYVFGICDCVRCTHNFY